MDCRVALFLRDMAGNWGMVWRRRTSGRIWIVPHLLGGMIRCLTNGDTTQEEVGCNVSFSTCYCHELPDRCIACSIYFYTVADSNLTGFVYRKLWNRVLPFLLSQKVCMAVFSHMGNEITISKNEKSYLKPLILRWHVETCERKLHDFSRCYRQKQPKTSASKVLNRHRSDVHFWSRTQKVWTKVNISILFAILAPAIFEILG